MPTLPTSNADGSEISTDCTVKGTFPAIRKPDFTFDEVKEALIAARGRHSRTAKLLNCCTRTIKNYIDRYPALKELEFDFAEARADMAEDVIEKHVENGHLGAAEFTAKVLRYNKQRVELSGPAGGALQFSLSPSDAVLL